VGWIFFILLVSVVSFNIMNLYVASMSSAYLEVQVSLVKWFSLTH
jgi:hypothetical protein